MIRDEGHIIRPRLFLGNVKAPKTGALTAKEASSTDMY